MFRPKVKCVSAGVHGADGRRVERVLVSERERRESRAAVLPRVGSARQHDARELRGRQPSIRRPKGRSPTSTCHRRVARADRTAAGHRAVQGADRGRSGEQGVHRKEEDLSGREHGGDRSRAEGRERRHEADRQGRADPGRVEKWRDDTGAEAKKVSSARERAVRRPAASRS